MSNSKRYVLNLVEMYVRQMTDDTSMPCNLEVHLIESTGTIEIHIDDEGDIQDQVELQRGEPVFWLIERLHAILYFHEFLYDPEGAAPRPKLQERDGLESMVSAFNKEDGVS